MEILVIILMVLISVAVIVFGVISHMKKTEREKYYVAAENILREDFLNYSLKNPLNNDGALQPPKGQKTMIYIKSKSGGKKVQFVFDPEKRIMIGRDKFNSNIYINEAFVSQQHCCIFSVGDDIYLQDLNSENGTKLNRGLLKRYTLFDGQCIRLRSNDSIIIGFNKFKITLFYFDMALM